jgi:dephospho-CoA kinase
LLKVGLTGGIGSGKSTAVDAFCVLGVPIIDADKISKKLVRTGQPTLNKIADTFGQSILLPNGELNRKALKEIIFSNPKSLLQLELILHPHIKLEIEKQIENLQNQPNPAPYCLVDIPLLVEKNYQSMFDRIVVIDCSEQQQIQRVQDRDNLDKSTIKKIMQSQACRLERKAAATDILDNSGTLESLNKQVKSLHKRFVSLA